MGYCATSSGEPSLPIHVLSQDRGREGDRIALHYAIEHGQSSCVWALLAAKTRDKEFAVGEQLLFGEEPNRPIDFLVKHKDLMLKEMMFDVILEILNDLIAENVSAEKKQVIQKLLSKIEREIHHHELLDFVDSNLNDEEKKKFKSVIDEPVLGLDDSAHYNRAFRRLCTSNAAKILLIIPEFFKHRFILNISVDERNSEGKHAADYALEHNPKAHDLMKNLIKEEYLSFTAETSKDLFKKLFGQDLEKVLKNAPPPLNLTTEQKEYMSHQKTYIRIH